VKVSVCIPTYNAAEFFRECIESVLKQTCKDLEIIVSDNASTDSTCEIVKSYSDPRIRLNCLERNEGMAFNFNHAVSLASGAYVKLLCADDFLEPTCLEKQIALLDRHPEVVAVGSGLRLVDETGKTLRIVSWLPRETLLRDVEVVAGTLAYGNLIGPPSAVLMRRESMVKAGSFCTDYPQVLDVDMWLRLAALGPAAYLPEPLCSFRLHAQATTPQLRARGVIRSDVWRLTESMLRMVAPTRLARRIAWGRVAGSFLKQAVAGFRHGHLKWPLAAVWQALSLDPAFAGLVMYLILIRSGLFGLHVGEGRALKVRPGRTLWNPA
jgi:glycosyltransferase involved in cell wall biosynthesis